VHYARCGLSCCRCRLWRWVPSREWCAASRARYSNRRWVTTILSNAFGCTDSAARWAPCSPGVFATRAVWDVGKGAKLACSKVARYSRPKRIAAAGTWVVAAVVTFVILKVLDVVMGLRVSLDDEQRGLGPQPASRRRLHLCVSLTIRVSVNEGACRMMVANNRPCARFSGFRLARRIPHWLGRVVHSARSSLGFLLKSQPHEQSGASGRKAGNVSGRLALEFDQFAKNRNSLTKPSLPGFSPSSDGFFYCDARSTHQRGRRDFDLRLIAGLGSREARSARRLHVRLRQCFSRVTRRSGKPAVAIADMRNSERPASRCAELPSAPAHRSMPGRAGMPSTVECGGNVANYDAAGAHVAPGANPQVRNCAALVPTMAPLRHARCPPARLRDPWWQNRQHCNHERRYIGIQDHMPPIRTGRAETTAPAKITVPGSTCASGCTEGSGMDHGRPGHVGVLLSDHWRANGIQNSHDRLNVCGNSQSI